MKKMNIVRNTITEGTETYREWSRIGSINHRIWSVIAPMLLVAFGLFGVNENAWAGSYSFTWNAWTAVGQGKGTAEVKLCHDIGITYTDDTKSTTNSTFAKAYHKEADSGWLVGNGSLITSRYAVYTASTTTGYDFEGWYTNADCTEGEVTTNPLKTSSQKPGNGGTTNFPTYYAKFRAHTYTIRFNANGGSGSMADQSHTYDQSKKLTANNFNRTGYTFAGWNTKANGTGTPFTDEDPVTNITSKDGDIINLYAQWTPNKYYVHFVGNGNSGGSMSKQELTYDQSANLTANAFTRSYTVTYDANGGDCAKEDETADYTFGGWAESSTGEKKYDDKDNVTNLTSTKNETIDLYAVWTGGTITLPTATKAGKVFDGWYLIVGTDTTYVGAKNANYDPTADVTLKALWADIASPKYTWNGAETCTYRVGDEDLDLDALWVSNNDVDAKSFELLSFTASGTNNDGATAPTLTGSILTLGQAGEVMIKVTQPASEYYYAGKDSLTLTINKHENTILVKGVENYRKEIDINSYDNGFTFAATNADYVHYPIQVEQIAGENIATYYDDQKIVYSGNMSGEAVWQVTQAENYYFAADTTTFAIDVRLAKEIVCYVIDDATEHSFVTGIDFSGHFDTPIEVGDPVKSLSFEAKKNGYNYFVAQYSTDNGSTWKDIASPDLSDSYQNFGPYNLPVHNITHIRFGAKIGATLKKWYKNIKLSRFTYLNLSEEAMTFDKTNENKPLYCGDATSKDFTIDWSMPENGGEINISSSIPEFTVSQAKIENTGCDDGQNTITVTYSSEVAGTFNGKIIVQNAVFYKEIAVTGTTIKRNQTITWTQNQNYITTDAITLVATASSELDPTYSVVEGTDVASVVETTGVVTILKAGDVKFRATQAGDDCYNEIHLDRVFHIALAPSTISMTNGEVAVSVPGAEANTLDLSSLIESQTDDNAEITYNITNEHVTIDGNSFSANAAGVYTLTATRAATDFYAASTSESFTVTVNTITPTINVSAVTTTAINYGQTLAEASFGGTVSFDGASVSETVDGQFVWVNENEKPNVGTETAKANFTSTHTEWFNAVENVDVAITVNPIAATTYAATTTIIVGQALSEAQFVNTTKGLNNESVDGQIAWGDAVDQTQSFEVAGTYQFAIKFTSENANYIDGTGICTVTVNEAKIFTGSTNNEWNNGGNWNGGEPGPDDRVVIDANVNVVGEITVGGITINAGKTVTVTDGAILTIGNNNSLTRETYGNLHVEKGGKVILGSGNVIVNDFTLEAKLGDAYNTGKSGQIFTPNSIVVMGDAYFELAMDPSNECSYGWYDFTVPFPVDALNGVTRYKNSNHEEQNITNEVHYAIMDFSESRRVATGYGWKKFRGIMQPGQCYSITTNNEDNVYRFKKTKTGAFNTQMTQSLAYTDVESDERGWNCLGNGTMAYADLSSTNIEKVQVYSHASNSYTAVNIDAYTYVVGSAYFVQAKSAGVEIDYAQNGATHTLRAPKSNREVSEFMLSLSQEGAIENDRLFIGASEEATEAYEIGKDLMKFGKPADAKVAQMWTTKGDYKLCDLEAALINDRASAALSFYAPQAQTYTLSVDQAPEDATLYLTYNGRVIWSLSASPYTIDLTKGTTEGYGLHIEARHNAPQVATGMDEVDVDQNGNRKVLIDNMLYILTPEGAMYCVTGEKVK